MIHVAAGGRRYTSLGSGLGFLGEVALDDKANLYVADLDHHRVVRIAPDGAQTTASRYVGNRGLAVGGMGNIFLASGHVVVRVAPGGVATELVSSLRDPWGLAIDRAGTLYLADQGRVILVPRTGKQAVLRDSVDFPRGIAVDRLGNVYIADNGHNRVIRVTPRGASTTVIAGLHFVGGVALDAAGNPYVSDEPRVLKLTPGGTRTALI